MAATIGPDGFVCLANDPRARHHAALDVFLKARQSGSANVDEAAYANIKKGFKKVELVAVTLTIYQRLDALEAHRGELAEAAQIAQALSRLALYLYKANLPFDEPGLCALLTAHRRHPVLWFDAAPGIVADYVAQHDLTPALASEIRSFQADFEAALRKAKYTGQAQIQVAQQHLHVLRWHDAWDEVDLDRCCSETIRRDVRAMSGEQRARWRALLRHIKGNAPTKPAPSWLKSAEPLLAAVGLDEFSGRLRAWLAPLRAGKPVPLSVAGSHVLRGLLWYAALAHDPSTTEAALWIIDAAWKPKRTAEKVAVALIPLFETMPPKAAWPPLERLQRAWPIPGGQIERLLKRVGAVLGLDEAALSERGLLAPADESRAIALTIPHGPVARLRRRASQDDRD